MAGLGLNGALWLGYSGLSTAQLQINTTGRNLANAETPGASRQRVDVSEDATVNIGGKALSVGVYALGISGTRSPYLDNLVQTESSNLGAVSATNDLMTLVQNALQETLSTTQTDGTETGSQTGLEAATTNFFSAWGALAADPTSSSLRDAVSAAGVSFVTTAQSVYNDMLKAKQSGFTSANSQIAEANGLISQITVLNKQIASAENGTKTPDGVALNQAGDLRDEREGLIEQLSSIVNVKVTTDPTNSSMVDIQLADKQADGYQVSTTSSVPITGDGGDIVFTDGDGNATTVGTTSGESASDIAASINASVGNVSASVVDGNLVLTSSSAISISGASAVATALNGGTSQTPSDSNAIMLVNGRNGGGVTATGAADPNTYTLALSGSDGSDDGGYAADKSLAVLAVSGTGSAVSVSPTGGILGGISTFDGTIGFQDEENYASGGTLLDKFNTYVNNVVTTVNGLVATGYDLNGNASTTNPSSGSPTGTGGSFFYNNTAGTASTGAWNLQVNSIYDYTNAAYDSDYIPAAASPVTSGTSDDGTLANSIGNAVNNDDIFKYYSGFVTDVGTMTSAAATNLSSQELVSNQAVTSQQSYSGISTDQEMTNLVSYQSAFEANSRFINTINQMYQLITQNLGQ